MLTMTVCQMRLLEVGMTLRESFESRVERELNLVRGTPGQYAQKNLNEDNNVKRMVVAGSKEQHLTDVGVRGAAECGRSAHTLWFPSSFASAFHGGRFQSGG